VAVIIPAFNESGGIRPTIDHVRKALARTDASFEIIVVDDGSTDDTGAQAEACADRVIRFSQNQGYGAALKAGIRQTSAEMVAIIDADGTYPPETLPLLLSQAADVDMVVGARSPRDTSIPSVRRPAKWFLGKLASYLAGQRIPDLNSGLRIIRRSVLMEFLHILPAGFSFTTTITLALLCNGYRVVYQPIVCNPRVGASKLRATVFSTFVMLVVRTVVLFNPLKVFLPMGGVLFLIGLAKGIYDVFLWNLSETAVMAFLAAIVVWSVGMLADMISRLQLRTRGVA
jgi:glycosyltransferase involved in cell wall biosynthesis